MARTFSRQSTEIKNSDVFDVSLTLANAESATATLEDDLNYIRTKLKDISGLTNWFTATTDGFNLEVVRTKRFTHWVQKFDDVSVPAGQNYVALTGVTKPGDVIAIGATALGAITAQLAGAIGSHSLTVTDANKNLCEVRDADTNSPIVTADGYQIYALLQVGSAATDGNAFGDTGDDQGQLSFVHYDETDTLAAVDIADIAGKTIEFAYRKRVTFASLPEHAFDPSITFAESVATMELPFSAKASFYTLANINVGDSVALASFTNPDNMNFGVVAATWVRNYDVYINGQLMESGVDLDSGADVYYSSSTAFITNRKIKAHSMIQVIQRK